MTPELERRWNAGQAPFDSLTVATCAEPELGVVREALSFVCMAVRDQYPSILVFADWHEHDGVITQPRPTSWAEVFSWLSSTDCLYASRDGDDLVRVAIFPESGSGFSDTTLKTPTTITVARCDFDFTCTPEASASGLVADLHSKWPGYTDISPAKVYFDRSYGG